MLEAYSDIIVGHNRVLAIRDWLTGTFAGRALLVGILIKSVALALSALRVPIPGLLSALDTIGDISLVVGASIAAYRVFVSVNRRLLWRVRRKLTLSYVFIGVVPALLIISFFLLCGLLVFFNVSSYLARTGVRALVERAQFLSQAGALELQRARDEAGFARILDEGYTTTSFRYPDASYAVVPARRTCSEPGGGAATAAPIAAVAAGPWTHTTPPSGLPDWVPCTGYAGLVTYADRQTEQREGDPAAPRTRLAVRAVTLPEAAMPAFAVVVDIPLTDAVVRQLQDDTGIALGDLSPLDTDEAGTGAPADTSIQVNVAIGARDGEADANAGFLERPLEWIAFLDYVDWESGTSGTVAAEIAMSISDLYARISAAPVAQMGNFSFGQVLLFLLAAVAGLFLVIQIVAFAMGLALARSITGSVHALFVGTERVRQGDFTHKIAVRSRDQLGELADSFNSMTASVEDLLQQKAEKERLAEELRIARAIQMSLLPQGPLLMPGLALAAHCEPAREVGGDYYDVLPIDGHRVGIVIADVAGKGTSAALYMAELKGVILSLSQSHRSPRALLVDANRIISKHLGPRSFITVTYAVIDLKARTLTHARAGHCPLIYLPGTPSPERRVQVLAPDGLVLGLQIDNTEMFDRLLQEATVPLATGDLIVLYTDGITEATNAEGEWFGDGRLAETIERHGALPFEQLRDRILGEIRDFVGSAAQHDDMTMVLVRVEA